MNEQAEIAGGESAAAKYVFYTDMAAVEQEMGAYLLHNPQVFAGKRVLVFCDGPGDEAFVQYFGGIFAIRGLAKLTAVRFADLQAGELHKDLLPGHDTVIAGLPFGKQFNSLWKALRQPENAGKQFAVIVPAGSFGAKSVFHAFKEGRISIGNAFYNINRANGKKSLCYWLSNIPHSRKPRALQLMSMAENVQYNHAKYESYDNYGALNINRVSQIPADYYGLMGVPVTFLLYEQDMFELVGLSSELAEPISDARGRVKKASGFFLHGKPVYARMVIKRKQG